MSAGYRRRPALRNKSAFRPDTPRARSGRPAPSAARAEPVGPGRSQGAPGLPALPRPASPSSPGTCPDAAAAAQPEQPLLLQNEAAADEGAGGQGQPQPHGEPGPPARSPHGGSAAASGATPTPVPGRGGTVPGHGARLPPGERPSGAPAAGVGLSQPPKGPGCPLCRTPVGQSLARGGAGLGSPSWRRSDRVLFSKQQKKI